MLRITVIESAEASKTLRLEGSIAGTLVDELRRLCSELLAGSGHAPLILDLAAVSFIDADGIDLMRDLGRRNTVLTNSSPFVAELLKEVVPC